VKALIDGDIIAYRVGFACQKKDKETGLVTADPKPYALHSTKLYVNQIIEDCGCTSYTIYLTPKKTFRNKVRDDYKANRKGIAKPVHLNAIRTYLVNVYKAVVVNNIEADDALGLKQDDTTCIASIDKDLLMCEGRHYNFVKKEQKYVTPEEGTRFFYQQMITGDTADNILGIRGLGKVKASKLLQDTARKEWDSMIIDLYIKEFGYDEGRNRCVQNSQLLWILQKGKQMPMDFSYEQVS
jgi:5'-3' exonuclease